MEYQLDVNKFAIIVLVGIAAISGIIFNQQNIASVCIGGLVGYLSKDYTSTVSDILTTHKTDEIITPETDDENKYDGA